MDQEKIGKFIASERKKKKLTQEELASLLNTTSKSISRWENGKTMPDYSMLTPLCEELDISIQELLKGERIKTSQYDLIANENLNRILKEYYQMKKQRNIIKTILIIVLILFVMFIIRVLLVLGIAGLSFLSPTKKLDGVENYDKSYFIEEYGGDLDSNLSIFPDQKDMFQDSSFLSSFQTNLFDSDGYIILTSKYSEEDFFQEIDRLKELKMVISNGCRKRADTYTNFVRYDEESYPYPAYVTIDGFGNTYEYALINEEDFEIIYVYLSYPSIHEKVYKKYLKNDLEEYSKNDTIKSYSMYNHSFDKGKSFMEYSDCPLES